MVLSSIEMMEVSFNIVYLLTIYVLVALMFVRRSLAAEDVIAKYFLLAFLLLAIGDTGHVGFRVIAYLNGGLDVNATLVGLGALSTAFTVGIFYILFIEIWRVRFDQPRDWFYYSLVGVGILRLAIFVLPQNEWGSVVPPFEWSLARNIPLMINGIAVAILMLLYARKENDRFFFNVAIWVFVSFGFYLPVILFVQQVPMIGMLMIPKTIAYVVIAWLVLQKYYTASPEVQ